MSIEEQKYIVEIGLREADDLTAIVCQKGADRFFADIINGEKFIVFYCCDGHKTLLRVDEICFLCSKKVGIGEEK